MSPATVRGPTEDRTATGHRSRYPRCTVLRPRRWRTGTVAGANSEFRRPASSAASKLSNPSASRPRPSGRSLRSDALRANPVHSTARWVPFSRPLWRGAGSASGLSTNSFHSGRERSSHFRSRVRQRDQHERVPFHDHQPGYQLATHAEPAEQAATDPGMYPRVCPGSRRRPDRLDLGLRGILLGGVTQPVSEHRPVQRLDQLRRLSADACRSFQTKESGSGSQPLASSRTSLARASSSTLGHFQLMSGPGLSWPAPSLSTSNSVWTGKNRAKSRLPAATSTRYSPGASPRDRGVRPAVRPRLQPDLDSLAPRGRLDLRHQPRHLPSTASAGRAARITGSPGPKGRRPRCSTASAVRWPAPLAAP